MEPSLHVFVRQFLGTVAAALAPVILVTFLSMPLSFGGHPGEARQTDAPLDRHMT